MKHWSLDLLKYQPFPELARAVRACAADVMARWEQAVQHILPAAHELTLKQVRNSLPETLDLMAAALEADQPQETKTLMDTAVTHGEDRFDRNFALNELMIEYGLLRPILIELTAGQVDRDLSVQEIQALNMAVDVVARRGVIQFVNEQKAQIQALTAAEGKHLAFLSHDLRGGLNGVLLMLEVLRRQLDEEPKFKKCIDDLETMRRSILDTVATMDRFLHAERFRKGKVQVHYARIDLADLAADVVGQFRYHAQAKDLELRCDVPAGASVQSDRELLMIILQNLVGNAVKYAASGQVRIVADPSCTHAEQGGCRISVIDQGPGIEPARLEQLFQPYMRGQTHGQEGAGLGLSIAQQAAELINARLWAQSHPGAGTSFHLDFSLMS